MGAPLKNPPVYFTIAQVRFNTILKLAEFLPAIQEKLRNAGFPDFGVQKSVVLQVLSQNGQPTPVPAVQEAYSFGNLDRTHAFLLEADKLTIQSTKYGSFQDFSELFLKGLTTVHEVVRLDFTERIGLRYLDRVIPSGSESLSMYLTSDVLALGNRLGGEALHSYFETLCEVGAIKLLSRIATFAGGVQFPPDLAPGALLVDARLAKYNGIHAILDNDGFYETREAYSLDAVQKHLTEIHGIIRAAFQATASAHAFKIWSQ
jgi:uncharacterized protein (TIGR04255 family)